MLHESNDFWRQPAEPTVRGATLHQADQDREYSQILVPTTMSPAEQPAILLGFQLAVATGASLTLLHVPPGMEPEPVPSDDNSGSVHWLEAIDSLHQALRTKRQLQSQARLKLLDEARGQLAEFVDGIVPAHLRLQTEARLECLSGDIIEEIARFAVAESADLVILTSELSCWNLPVVPSRLHRVLQKLRTRVIVMRPETVTQAHADHRRPARIEH